MLKEDLAKIEERAREGLSSIGFSELNYCHRCPYSQAKWIRFGVHEIASALWDLHQIIKKL